MDEFIRVMLVVSNITREDWDCVLNLENKFVDGRQTVYNERLFGVGGFPFFSLYCFPCTAKQVTILKQLRPLY